MNKARKKLPDDFNVNTIVNELFTKQTRYGNETPVGIYYKIIQRIDTTDENLVTNPHFIKDVREFFVIKRRTCEFIVNFCSLIRVIRNQYECYDIHRASEMLSNFSKSTNEISFASKLLNLADPEHSFVIYDRNVRMCFGLENINSYERLNDEFNNFKNKIQSGSQEKLCVEYRRFISVFDKRLEDSGIILSENKKIDFYLWEMAKHLE